MAKHKFTAQLEALADEAGQVASRYAAHLAAAERERATASQARRNAEEAAAALAKADAAAAINGSPTTAEEAAYEAADRAAKRAERREEAIRDGLQEALQDARRDLDEVLRRWEDAINADAAPLIEKYRQHAKALGALRERIYALFIEARAPLEVGFPFNQPLARTTVFDPETGEALTQRLPHPCRRDAGQYTTDLSNLAEQIREAAGRIESAKAALTINRAAP
ncbi:MAG: hypothetical protein AAFS07_11965 [Pseudomonadota bacterium]